MTSAVRGAGHGRSDTSSPLVLKIGGSLAASSRLDLILRAVERASRPVVIVPGGGPFADAVRQSQAALGYDDRTAHRMALLAMHQMAEVLCGKFAALQRVHSNAEMRQAWQERWVPIWFPFTLMSNDHAVPLDWSVTSDGLAARLAEVLGDVPVVLVKSCAVPASADAAELARRGIVDLAFADIVARAELDWRVLGCDDDAELEHWLGRNPLFA
ncbi:MAG: amino acid kinase family protein [Hyphomicrobium sp.]